MLGKDFSVLCSQGLNGVEPTRPRQVDRPEAHGTTMRAWLVDDKNGASAGSLEALLRELEERPGTGLRLLGASPFQPDFTAAMRKLVPELLDLLVIHECFWPEGPWT